MTYTIEERWRLFVNNLEHAASEDVRQVYVLVERDRWNRGLHDTDLRRAVEQGRYGADAMKFWQAFKNA